MNNKKGIDWTKKDIYDGIGRPDLRPDFKKDEVVIECGEVKYAKYYKAYYIKWDSSEPESALDAFLSSDCYKDLKYKNNDKVELVVRIKKEKWTINYF